VNDHCSPWASPWASREAVAVIERIDELYRNNKAKCAARRQAMDFATNLSFGNLLCWRGDMI
jgi:hypothetical protein